MNISVHFLVHYPMNNVVFTRNVFSTRQFLHKKDKTIFLNAKKIFISEITNEDYIVVFHGFKIL